MSAKCQERTSTTLAPKMSAASSGRGTGRAREPSSTVLLRLEANACHFIMKDAVRHFLESDAFFAPKHWASRQLDPVVDGV